MLPTNQVYVNKPGTSYSPVNGSYPVRNRVVQSGSSSFHGLCELLGLVAIGLAVAGAILVTGKTHVLRGLNFNVKNPFSNVANPFANRNGGGQEPLIPVTPGVAPNLPSFPEQPIIYGPNVQLEMTTVTFTHPTTGNKITTRGYASPSNNIAPGVPGPTIRVNPGDEFTVTLCNRLTLPNPDCVGDADDICHLNSTNFHTHGLHVSGEHPGDSIFVTILPQQCHTYKYKVREDHMPGTHWCHPHFHHSTSVQAGGGAHLALIVQDRPGTVPPVIANAREITLVVSMLNIEGLTQNAHPVNEQALLKFSEGAEDVCMVNGAFQPRIPIVAGKWTRLRFVYAAIERSLSIPVGEGCEFQLIAKDGIYLNVAPRPINTIWLVPGGRADVMVRCDANVRRLVNLESKGHAITKGFGYSTEITYNNVLLVLDVFPNQGARDPDLKPFKVTRPCYLADLRNAPVLPQHKHTLGLHPTKNELTKEYFDKFGPNFLGAFYVSFDGHGQAWPHHGTMSGSIPPPAGTFPVGTVQEWTVMGTAVHPLHMHVNPYQIIDGVTPDGMSGRFFENGDWHDTYMSLLDTITIRFQADHFTGKVVLHCHLLRHEDHGMMTYFQATGQEGTCWNGAKQVEPGCIAANSPEAGFSYVNFVR